MKQFASDSKVLYTAARRLQKKAFTLIEVMVAVMIISVVIMALLQINANNTQIFSQVKNKANANQYISLLLETKYGFENDNISLEELVSDFNLDDDFRRELKNTKVQIIYKELQSINPSLFDEEEDQEQQQENISGTTYEIGVSTLKTKFYSSSLVRLRIK